MAELPSNNEHPAGEEYRGMDEFIVVERLGEGTFGRVYKVRDIWNGGEYAIKLFKKPIRDINRNKEIAILREISHPNVVQMYDIIWNNMEPANNYNREVISVDEDEDVEYARAGYYGYSMELARFSLRDIIVGSPPGNFREIHIQVILNQTLKGVKYLHENGIIHRDLKPANLMVTRGGEIKISDFGSARHYDLSFPHVHCGVCLGTTTYLPPEILLGAQRHWPNLDSWSIGCTFIRTVLRRRLFRGSDRKEVAKSVFKVLGTPNEQTWPGVYKLPLMKYFKDKPYPGSDLSTYFQDKGISDTGMRFLNRLLELDPEKRINAEEALNHVYIRRVTGIDRLGFADWLRLNMP